MAAASRRNRLWRPPKSRAKRPVAEGGYYWRWLIEDSMPMLIAAAGGLGCLFGAHKLRTGNRLRKKIANIVGDSQYMYIEDIAAAIPCGYDKCRKQL